MWKLALNTTQSVNQSCFYRSLVEVEIELDGYRTSLHCLNSESDRLRTIVDNSLKHKQDLYTKHRRIQEFQNFTVCMNCMNVP